MGGRDQPFFALDEEEIAVRGVVESYFRAEDPARLAEVDYDFDLVYSMVDDQVDHPKVAGDRALEALDPSFFVGTVVSSAIWAATLIYRQAKIRNRSADERLAEILAELIGNPEMIGKLRELIAQLPSLAALASGRAAGQQLRNVVRRADPEAEAEPSSAAAVVPPLVAPVQAAGTPLSSRDPDLSLFVTTKDDASGRLEFRLRAKDPRLALVYNELGDRFFGPTLRNFVDELTREVLDLHERRAHGRATRLQRLGERLAAQLIPERLASELEKLRGEARSLIVYADVFVPWELLCFPDRPGRPGAFWGEAFALTRWFTGCAEGFDLPLRNIGVIAPASNLRATVTESAAMLALAGNGRQVTRLKARSRELLPALFPCVFDTLHFAGHGMASRSANPDLGTLELDGDEALDAVDIPRFGFGDVHPLVFLNACHSGKGGPRPTGIGGLAKAFVDAGAAAIVGCHWAIADDMAELFAGELYRLLLAGQPLGEAGRQARHLLRRQKPEDPTWIAYSIFGQPLASCSSG